MGAAYAASPGESEPALIIKIGKFVRWPETAFANSSGAPEMFVFTDHNHDASTFAICSNLAFDLHGNLWLTSFNPNAEGDAALDTLNGKKLQDRVIEVAHLSHEDSLAGCQIIFINRSERERLAELLAAVARTPVLTVSDMQGFVAQGGMIGFTAVNGTTGFEINRAASSRAGLTIGAQLLQIAAAGTQAGKR